MYFDRNINGNRDVKFLECDYLSCVTVRETHFNHKNKQKFQEFFLVNCLYKSASKKYKLWLIMAQVKYLLWNKVKVTRENVIFFIILYGSTYCFFWNFPFFRTGRPSKQTNEQRTGQKKKVKINTFIPKSNQFVQYLIIQN